MWYQFAPGHAGYTHRDGSSPGSAIVDPAESLCQREQTRRGWRLHAGDVRDLNKRQQAVTEIFPVVTMCKRARSLDLAVRLAAGDRRGKVRACIGVGLDGPDQSHLPEQAWQIVAEGAGHGTTLVIQ